MPTTSPDSISYPDTSTTGGFIAAIAAMATSIQAALSKRGRKSYQWADATARGAQAGMASGETGIQADTLVVYKYNGSAWKAWESDWITYTPTLANVTLGTAGTSTFKYRYQLGSVRVLGYIKLGTSGMAMGTAPTFTLPVNATTLVHSNQSFPGSVKLYDDSAAGDYIGESLTSGSSVTTGLLRSTSSTLANAASITATVPYTWAANDCVDIDLTYEPA